MTHDERQDRSFREDGVGAIRVGNLEDFIEAAGRQPRSLVILESDEPPSIPEVRRYCLALGGLRKDDEAGDVRRVQE